MISHKLGIDMLVGPRMLEHGRDVNAALVGKRRIAHKWLVLPRLPVRKLRNEARHIPQLTQIPLWKTAGVHLEYQVRDNRDQVRIPAPLAISIDGSLNMVHTLRHRRQRVCHSTLGVVVDVDAERRLHVPLDLANDLGDLMRERTPVGIAQNQNVAASFLGSTKSAQSILSVSLKAIKEMFRVVYHLLKPAQKKTDGIRDHRQVFFEGCLE